MGPAKVAARGLPAAKVARNNRRETALLPFPRAVPDRPAKGKARLALRKREHCVA
jgi:hypothetical protein